VEEMVVFLEKREKNLDFLHEYVPRFDFEEWA